MSCRCFIGKIPRTARSDDVRDLFREFRDIREITLKDGYGFIEFSSENDARDAVRYYDRKEFMGERIAVEMARPKNRPMATPSRPGQGFAVTVENLPDCSWQSLKDHFRTIGRVMFADVDRNRHEGVVEFSYREDVDRAVRKLDRTKFMGETIRVREDRGSRRDRSRSRDRRRSRSRDRGSRRDRSRSRSRDRGSSRRDRSRSRSRDRYDDRNARTSDRTPSPGR